MSKVEVYKKYDSSFLENDFSLWEGDSLELLKNLPHEGLFDLVVTSPPYNIGKEYEENLSLNDYFEKHRVFFRAVTISHMYMLLFSHIFLCPSIRWMVD